MPNQEVFRCTQTTPHRTLMRASGDDGPAGFPRLSGLRVRSGTIHMKGIDLEQHMCKPCDAPWMHQPQRDAVSTTSATMDCARTALANDVAATHACRALHVHAFVRSQRAHTVLARCVYSNATVAICGMRQPRSVEYQDMRRASHAACDGARPARMHLYVHVHLAMYLLLL